MLLRWFHHQLNYAIKESLFLETILLQTHSIPAYTNMNHNKAADKFPAFIQDQQKQVARASKYVLHNQLKILKPLSHLRQLCKAVCSYIKKLGGLPAYRLDDINAEVVPVLFQGLTMTGSKIWCALVNSIYVHTISTNKMTNYLPTHISQVQFSSRPIFFSQPFF